MRRASLVLAMSSASVGPSTSSMINARPDGALLDAIQARRCWDGGATPGRALRARTAQTPRVAKSVRQDFDGDIALKPRVSRAINPAHAALTQQGGHLVGTEPRAWGERHGEILMERRHPGLLVLRLAPDRRFGKVPFGWGSALRLRVVAVDTLALLRALQEMPF